MKSKRCPCDDGGRAYVSKKRLTAALNYTTITQRCFLSSSTVHHSPPQDTPSILDWPLPQPAYDEVTTELEDQSEDQEVRSINKGLAEETVATPGATTAGRSESQSADLFQELQREVEKVL